MFLKVKEVVDMYNIDQNDQAKMAELWAEVAPKIEAAAINYKAVTGLNEDIDDLTQDGYLALLKAIDSYDPEQYPDVPFASWVVIQCKGMWSKYIRSRDPLRNAISLDAPAYGDRTVGDFVADTVADDDEPSVEDRVIRDLLMAGYMDLINQLMGNLEPETAALLRAYYIEGTPLSQLHAENASAKIRAGLRQLRRALIARGINVEGGLHYDGI